VAGISMLTQIIKYIYIYIYIVAKVLATT
jgi:hypothetical protein